MKKIETVWNQILFQVLEQRQTRFQQQELAKKLGMSLSTVNHAFKDLRLMGAVEVGGKGGEVTDAEKVLMHWANQRRLGQDIAISLTVKGSVKETESLLPSGSILAGYSAVRAWYKEAPADYSTVYVYHQDPDRVKARFEGQAEGETSLVCLRLLERLVTRKETTTLGHTFVDLWSLSDWMAKEFIKRVKQEIDEILS